MKKIIGPELIKQRFNVGDGLAKIDRFMIDLDASKNKSRLGANAILGVSMACARAGAAVKVGILESIQILWILMEGEERRGEETDLWYRASRCTSSCEKKREYQGRTYSPYPFLMYSTVENILGIRWRSRSSCLRLLGPSR